MEKDIEKAAEQAAHLVAAAAEDALKVVAHSAAEEVLRVEHERDRDRDRDRDYMSDHDLLIKLNAKMEGLKDDIKELKNGYNARIDDHESRIKSIESGKTAQTVLISIGTGLLVLLSAMLIYHLFQTPLIK